MSFFLHDMEELYYGGSDGDHGGVFAKLPDAKIPFVGDLHRDRSVADSFQRSLRQDFFKSICKNEIKNVILDAVWDFF